MGQSVGRNFTSLFEGGLFSFDTNLVPEVIKTYKDLHVKHEHLTLIQPQG